MLPATKINEWWCCADDNHEILGRRLEERVGSEFTFSCKRFVDFEAISRRAAGGYPVQYKKVECIINILATKLTQSFIENKKEEWFIWSDVDVQPLGSLKDLRSVLEAQIENNSDSIDLFTQREFDDCGINLGFLLIRFRPTALDLFLSFAHDMTQCKGMLDQKLFNQILLNNKFESQQKVRRLPSIIWASSNAQSRPLLQNLVLHHANFIPSSEWASDSKDPQPKLNQLDFIASISSTKRHHSTSHNYDCKQDSDQEKAFFTFLNEICQDPTLSAYRDRHFPFDIRSQQWPALLLLWGEE
mmetsp:Transcript_13007/g.17419  ORF Transcript_13007/g.17419 Transcript_13007/m.17419 type:complete len:301 (+) Transcript_13007:82-984(+)